MWLRMHTGPKDRENPGQSRTVIFIQLPCPRQTYLLGAYLLKEEHVWVTSGSCYSHIFVFVPLHSVSIHPLCMQLSGLQHITDCGLLYSFNVTSHTKHQYFNSFLMHFKSPLSGTIPYFPLHCPL